MCTGVVCDHSLTAESCCSERIPNLTITWKHLSRCDQRGRTCQLIFVHLFQWVPCVVSLQGEGGSEVQIYKSYIVVAWVYPPSVKVWVPQVSWEPSPSCSFMDWWALPSHQVWLAGCRVRQTWFAMLVGILTHSFLGAHFVFVTLKSANIRRELT